jgi:hypothetical protein
MKPNLSLRRFGEMRNLTPDDKMRESINKLFDMNLAKSKY